MSAAAPDPENENDRLDDLIINPQVRIPSSALNFRFARSSGPGGQHIIKLASYLDKEGVLHVESQQGRSQLRNREEVVERFAVLLRQALIVPKKRRPTKPSKAAKEKRLDSKKKSSTTKKMRRERVEH